MLHVVENHAPAAAGFDPRAALAKESNQGPAMRYFFKLAAAWNLSNEEAMKVLGDPAESTFFRWKRGEVSRVPSDTMRRISYLLGIQKALRFLHTNEDNLIKAVTRPSAAFGGQSALQRIVNGDQSDMATVRRYFDNLRG